MQFYEQHYARYCLREYIGMWYPNILGAVLYWIMIKLNIKRLKRKPFPVFRSVQDNLMDLDQVPEIYQAEIQAELNLLSRYGFVDPLVGGVISGSSLNGLTQTGISLLSRHQKVDSAVSVIIDFHEGQTTRRPYFIFTFIEDPPSDITSSNGRLMCYSDPGGDIAYYPNICFEELLQVHNQRIMGLNKTCLIINDNEELIRLSDERLVKSIDKLIRRGILALVEPK
ncbi:hypothetical protein [Gimesia fumaroli]|uniref:Uncharacterized protein n=1 Tax=Gimesia fumaroli TaxID=2527976 RepID=A0A518II38_9PLAN|nr:hypothetical protein [Gimesia fumaroli]QDV52756.1 hypothetical protein Enr17x_48230 [Gimesia fumaroli]